MGTKTSKTVLDIDIDGPDRGAIPIWLKNDFGYPIEISIVFHHPGLESEVRPVTVDKEERLKITAKLKGGRVVTFNFRIESVTYNVQLRWKKSLKVRLKLSEFKNIGDEKSISTKLFELTDQGKIWIKVNGLQGSKEENPSKSSHQP